MTEFSATDLLLLVDCNVFKPIFSDERLIVVSLVTNYICKSYD